MKSKFTKYLSIITILLMMFSSMPQLTVNAAEADHEKNDGERSGLEVAKDNFRQENDSKVSSPEEPVVGSKEETKSKECNSEEVEDESKEENMEDSDQKNNFGDCDPEENNGKEDSDETTSESESNGSETDESEDESTEEDLNYSTSGDDKDESTKKEETEESSTKEAITESDLEDETIAESQNGTSKMSLSFKESRTSKLGHIKSGNVKIYKDEKLTNSFVAGERYTHKVYYIKKQADIGGELYYLISNSPSSVNGVVGWAHSKDLSIHSHKSFDKHKKTFYFKGNGKTYSKAWGGKKDVVYNDLKPHKGAVFQVHLTEKVGNNTWYRGTVDGKRMWIHSSYVTEDSAIVSDTSRLGHIRTGNVKIYDDLSLSNYKTAGSQYTHKVYYIKSKAKLDNKTYYLISTSPSKTKGTIGWVRSNDLSTHKHNGTDKTPKEFYFNGKGKAYSKAWGGKKDLVESNLNKLKSQVFEVDLTENVGKNIWYRGTINGKRAWVHSSYLTTEKESKISKLGHLRTNAKIYKELGKESTELPVDKYKDAVYYIKQQATINDDLFYLLSTSPSSTKGVVGWSKSDDVSTHTHKGIDKTPKVFHFNGKGKAYTKAWGGSKDLVYGDMRPFEKDLFKVNMTEKVGNNTWYRGKHKGKTVWIHSSYISKDVSENYDLTLDEAVDIQMNASAQTDQKYAYVSKTYIKNNKVTTSALNVRTGPSTSGTNILGTLKKNTLVSIISEPEPGWYQIEHNSTAWVDAARKDVKFHLDPVNFLADSKLRFQFLDLSRTTSASASKLNQALVGKGILQGQGQAFIDGGNRHGINDLYLISHAFLETGNGTSKLAQGIEVGKNTSGDPTLVTKKNRKQLKEIKKVYNMYGIGAYDNCAIDCGAKHAYKNNWTTPESAIIGGAKFIGADYISKGQNTLYKMRWNPLDMDNNGDATHQYATDVGWASKQVNTMYNLYDEFGINSPNLEIPVYK